MNSERSRRVGAMLDAKSAAVAAEKHAGDVVRAASCRPPCVGDAVASAAHPVLRDYERLLREHGWRAFVDGDPPTLCIKRPDDREASIRFSLDGENARLECRLSPLQEAPVPLRELTRERIEQIVERFVASLTK